VVPNFAALYTSMQAKLPAVTLILIAIGTTARNYILFFFVSLVGLVRSFPFLVRARNRPVRKSMA